MVSALSNVLSCECYAIQVLVIFLKLRSVLERNLFLMQLLFTGMFLRLKRHQGINIVCFFFSCIILKLVINIRSVLHCLFRVITCISSIQ